MAKAAASGRNRKLKGNIALVILVVLAAISWYAWHLYTQKNPDMADEQATVTISAQALIDAFGKDSASANRLYTDKILAVSGTVKKLDANGNPVVFFLGQTGDMSSVKCSMDSTHATSYKAVAEGTKVIIRGRCTGGVTDPVFGTDVTLNFCVLQDH